MKKTLGFLGLVLAVGASAAPDKITTAFHTGYIPDGFDTNDQIQIVGEGLFPNSCYRPASVAVNVDHNKKTVDVKPTAYVYDGFCLQVILPYHHVVDLGILKNGIYTVKQNAGNDDALGFLNVRLSSNSGPDDFLYAPVTQSYFSKRDGKNYLTLAGEFSSSCMKLTDVVVNPQEKVVVIQPVAEMADSPNCVSGKFPFETTAEVKDVKPGRYLLHVRSMNGKALNNLVDIE